MKSTEELIKDLAAIESWIEQKEWIIRNTKDEIKDWKKAVRKLKRHLGKLEP